MARSTDTDSYLHACKNCGRTVLTLELKQSGDSDLLPIQRLVSIPHARPQITVPSITAKPWPAYCKTAAMTAQQPPTGDIEVREGSRGPAQTP